MLAAGLMHFYELFNGDPVSLFIATVSDVTRGSMSASI
jgi:hypothetical protein